MSEEASEAVPRRKIPHFGWLFTAAVLLGTVAIVVAWILPVKQQIELIRAIETRGGKVTIRRNGPSWVQSISRFVSARLVNGKPELGLLDHVEGVDLRLDSFDSTLIPELSLFPRLSDLQLSHSALDDHDLLEISRLTSLHTLAVVHCDITGSGFAGLESMPKLESVDLSFSPVRDAALDHLERIPRLKIVYVYGCRYLTPDGLIEFAKRRTDVAIAGVPQVIELWKETGLISSEQEIELSALVNADVAEKVKSAASVKLSRIND